MDIAFNLKSFRRIINFQFTIGINRLLRTSAQLKIRFGTAIRAYAHCRLG
ncbi:hypothetical protein [Xanthomonas prunicola]|uniref:Uncharacterized protein n=1 Tax=Xanthomonas prunicola TaxID=2053930 RepID=A0A9Q9IYW8_9XANT|nr:hypothetical protein [Xanthomonas prunicola]UXA65601.1 hypothetical protein M0D43_00635 [Xanthomonas prunicola]